jgi:repressor LexA
MDMWDQLTERQQRVYEFIRDKIRNRGYGPTVREIGENFEIKSPNGVMCHLKALEKKGLITRERNMSRAIQLTAEPRGLRLAGRIAAGVLHEAIEQDERIDFGELFSPDNESVVALQVHGESMIDDQIASGDYVIVDRRRAARKGQIVVAVTEEGEATLKRWFPEKGRVRLQPANATMKPIFVKNAEVFGVVVGVVRQVQ